MDITYVGEHTFIGQLGRAFVVLAFMGAALAAWSFFRSERSKDESWKALGRLGFRIHSLAVLGIVAALFIMLLKQYFEYDYVWKHSNSTMPLRYILSCFWEGQEGSFLLWTFWHVILGNILIARGGKWEAPVMAVFAVVQVFLGSMLLGIHAGSLRIGSDPFILIRELPENIGLPWTAIPDYMAQIPQFADGRGLNPLLQNYWMTIHPPTLFLGFAATLPPFAYAIAGLWRKDLNGWIKPALPWTFFGIMILGTGILMGGAWAYEALSFGGFWAWDPVENASLVPWLTLVGSGHLMLINQRKGSSLFTTFLLTLTTFILILYSTFLTRSGVLGDTSVHSFTGDGMLAQLLVYLLFFVALSTSMIVNDRNQNRFYWLICIALLVIGVLLEIEVLAIILFFAISIWSLFRGHRAHFRSASEEEHLWSREFWMFIGALVLTLSAAQIIFSTSIPVTNMLLEPFGSIFSKLGDWSGIALFDDLAKAKLAPPADAIAHYNRWQIPFAFIIALLVSVGQYLRYKRSDVKQVFRQLLLPVLLATVLTVAISVWMEYGLKQMDLIALLFTSLWAVTANAWYIWKGLRGHLKLAGASIAHVGFALVLLGALVSTSGQDEISRNAQGMDLRFLSKDFSNSTDILLFRGDTVLMGDHFVTYSAKEKDGVNLKYQVDYLEAVPAHYKKGEIIEVTGVRFRAKDDHIATASFLLDQPQHWEEASGAERSARPWLAYQVGAPLFQLEPMVQLNPRFGNVAEPSTRHWIDRDLYTHIRYADLELDSAGGDDGYMPARLYEKNLGDTIVTPLSVIILDSIKTVRDSVTTSILGEDHMVFLVQLRVRDLYKTESWRTIKPIIIYRQGKVVATKPVENNELRVKYEVESVSQGKVGLNVYEQEFIVMQAIVFPGINILWIGCILLFLGTLMAVVQRIRIDRTKST